MMPGSTIELPQQSIESAATNVTNPVSTDHITPGQHCMPNDSTHDAHDTASKFWTSESVANSSETGVEIMDESNTNNEEWNKARSRKRSHKTLSDSASSSGTVRKQPNVSEGLTVIFAATKPDQKLATLSSLRLSNALEKLCPECILQIRPNERLNVVAVDVRNGQTTRTLLKCPELCGVSVRAYQSLEGPTSIGVIKNVDAELSDPEILENLRSDGRIARVRRLGATGVVMLTFNCSPLPSFVLLGRVRQKVTEFKPRPIQCRNCGGFGHFAVSCTRSSACSRCAEPHPITNTTSNTKCKSTVIKCVNCGEAHEATSPACSKWREEQNVVTYAKRNAVDYRSARIIVKQASGVIPEPILNVVANSTSKKSGEAPVQDRQPPALDDKGLSYAAALKTDPQKNIERPPNNNSATTSNKPKPAVTIPTGTEKSTCNGASIKKSEHSTGVTNIEPTSTADSSKRLPRDAPEKPTANWIKLFRIAAEMACAYLDGIDASWAHILCGFIQAAFPLLNIA
ncbi:uncharacterized protein LOC121838540 [Ixodes scapularis]|uniref:uncharacterized protein LOC121838540 n=1 Tax=Ixodes scapularis TaxID=6945 RepID=UPI001C391AA1|nr:uncharacterized protein LOC121838540 [Ixodes scapularis]